MTNALWIHAAVVSALVVTLGGEGSCSECESHPAQQREIEPLERRIAALEAEMATLRERCQCASADAGSPASLAP